MTYNVLVWLSIDCLEGLVSILSGTLDSAHMLAYTGCTEVNWTWTRSPIQVLTGPDVGYLPLIESNALSLQQTTTPPVYHQYAVTTAESCICQLLMFCSHCFVLCRHECITVLGRLLIMSVSTICSLRSDIFIHVPLSPIPSPATTTWTYKNLLITV